jgi:hypothetical protein
MPSFSERHGYSQPKGITYRDELPVGLRIPIFEILEREFHSGFLWKRIKALLNPYGTDDDYDDWVEIEMSTITAAAPGSTQAITAGEDRYAVAAKRVLLTCPWFRVYDVIEDIFGQLVSYYADPDEQYPRSVPFQRAINDYFKHVGIGWQLVEGKIVTRGDEVFEETVKTAVAVLEEDAKPSRRTSTVRNRRTFYKAKGQHEWCSCTRDKVLGEITGQTTTLGKYLHQNPTLFHPALKKGLDGIYGYASEEGARHGKEGTEPTREEAEFAVAVCAAVCTLLARKRPK